MDELHEPPLASRTQSAAKVWQNAVIRHNLIQLCERNTVVNLARVSKEAFIGAVAVLWAVQWCPIALQQAMNCVTDVNRYLVYSRSIRCIWVTLFHRMTLAPLLNQYPFLRAVSSAHGPRSFSCEWVKGGNDERTHAIVDITFGPDDPMWAAYINDIRSCLPDDWRVVYRPSWHIIHPDNIAQFQARLDAGHITLQNLNIGQLSGDSLTRLVRSLKCYRQRNQRLAAETSVRLHPSSDDDALLSLLAWSGVADNITLNGYWLCSSTIHTLAPLMRSFRSVSFSINPWMIDLRPGADVAFNYTRSGPLAAQEGFKLRTVHCQVKIAPHEVLAADIYQTARNVNEALDYLLKDSVWLRNLAKLLLTLGGPSVEYTVQVSLERTDVPMADGLHPRLAQDNATHALRFKDAMAMLIECRYQYQRKGWRKLRFEERRP